MPGSESQVRKDSRLFEELCRALLQRGHAVRFQVNGQSMQPNLNDGDIVVVAPAAAAELRRGDVVLARNAEGLRVHRVTSRNSNSSTVTLQSDTGHAPDVPARHVYGRVCLRKHQRREDVFSTWRTQHAHPTRSFARRLRIAAALRLRRFLPSLFAVIPLTACLFFTPVTHAQTADLQLTQTASATAVATNAYTQSLGTATTATWSGGTATFTFPTPLPSGVFPNAALTTTGFTPNVYDVTNASVTSVNYAAGTVSIALSSQSMGTASAATWSSAGGGTASFTFPTPLPSEAVVGAQLTTTGFTPTAYNVTNATITSVAGGVVTVALPSQTTSTATSATWAGNTLTFTFPTPLPTYAVNGATITTAGFAPASYNVTNATIANVNAGAGTITVTLNGNQSLGRATAASWTGGVLTLTFPTPLGSLAVVGDRLTTSGFNPGTYNLTNQTITSVNPATGVVTIAVANPGTLNTLGNGTANPAASATTPGTASVGPATATARGTGTVNPSNSSTNGIGSVRSGYSYSEVVTNNASSATVTTGTINVYMQTPPNTIFESYTGTNWSCTTPATGGTGPVICTYNTTLASGATASTLTVAFQIASGTTPGTTIQGSATVTNSTFTDTAPSNNTSISSIVVEPPTTSDLAVSMSVAPTPVFISSTFSYAIQVQNLGQAAAPVSANVLTDTLPAGLTNVSVVASSGWSCTGTATINCSITSPMAMGTTATITISATTPADATTLSNTATASLTGDPNANNNAATAYTVVQPISCATPGRDGAGGTLTGVVNTYYPPANTGTLASGSTSVALGTAQGNTGKPIAAGDLVLIIQMQGASINSSNTSSYGHGVPGDPGSGWTSLGSSGLFEFVTATGFSGGTLTFTGTGPTGGLLNSYIYQPATATQGVQTYQVIRVPQYASATLSSTLVPLAWPGTVLNTFVGGVLAIDVSSQLTLGGTVALDALGFRGGGGITMTGTTNAVLDTDYVTTSPANLPNLSGGGDAPANSGTNGSKGEGIAGTPHWVAPLLKTVVPTSTALSTGQSVLEGLPVGSFARGAPGNAGGGGTDGDPVNNDENSGGGAGSNGGAGGQGGYGWNSMAATNTTDGGFGGAAFPASTSALVMGGGGGAGTVNNGTYYISSTNNGADCGTSCTGVFSSGGSGGGIAIIHTGSVTGTGTITSNGASTLSTRNDSTGGGGAGGSILIFANSGGLAGLTVSAIGGSGGNAWPAQAPGGFPGQRHGPGGGGGGGVILLTATPASSNASGGANGYTNTVQDSYGSTPGLAGVVQTNLVITETPGTQSGAYCGSADLAVTNSGSPSLVLPGGNITYTQTITNSGPLDAVNAVFSEGIPANTTFQSISTNAGWTCVTPVVGGTGTISCSNPDFASGGSIAYTVVVQVGASTQYGTQIVDVDNIVSGTSDPNLANNTATAISTVTLTTEADLAVTNAASAPTVVAGNNVTMTAVVTNNGPATAAFVTFAEAIPANTTLGAAFTPPSGWSCNTIPVGGTGTLTCTNSSFASGGSSTFPVVLNVTAGTAAGTVISATADVNANTTDPNNNNNEATATTVVASAGQADLAVTASGMPNPVTPNNNITYTQSATNNGPTAITASGTTSVTFTDAIPANTTLGATFTPPAGWTCNTIAVGAIGTFTCTLNSGQTFGIGTVFNFPLVVKVNPGVAPGTTITNSPNIGSSVGDPNTGNNTATVNTLVASPSQADVTIVKTASPEPVNQGTTLTYTIIVKNGGPAAAQNVTVTDPIPAEVTYSSSTTSMGTCSYSSGTNTVSCSVGTLAVGTAAVITINVNAATFSGPPGVSCPGYASNVGSCNTATVSTTTSNVNTNTSSSAGSTIQASTAVDLSAFNAFALEDGTVRLVWRTHEESRNLGFHIYREGANGRRRLDSTLIGGSALLMRGSKPQHAAKAYSWIDAHPVSNAAYWIEDVDINGTRTMHGPAYVEVATAELAPSLRAVAPTASPALRQVRANLVPALPALRTVTTPRPVLPNPPANTPRFNAAAYPAVKISIDHEGWYRITLAQLFAAGLDANTDLRSLRLFAEGVEQPALLTGPSSGFASPTDAIEFYGTGIDTPFSGTRVYWLLREGSYGKRILTAPSSNSGSPVTGSFPFTVIREDRSTYFAALLNGENNDNFFGAVITSDAVDSTLNVAHRDTLSSQPVTLEVTLQGVTDAQLHSVGVQLNGAPVGAITFFGEILYTQSFAIDPSLVLDGTNTVTLTALNGDNDVSVTQSMQLHYPHTYEADSNWLRATANAGSTVHISGFTNAQVRMFDITDPLNIVELSSQIAAESGSFGILATLPPGFPYSRTILAFAEDQVAAPSALTYHSPAANNRGGADIVMITHPEFTASLEPLVRLRESQGHRVALVTTDQIYDQYNFGEHSPFAVRSFLQDATQHWNRKPQAVLLVGDASLDPRNYLGFGDFDFVPTRIIETAAFKTASDDWFSDFQQTGYATIPTGRLPVRTAADADLLVSKIVGYEQGRDAGAWNSQAFLIADQNAGANFGAAVTAATATLPSSLQPAQLLADGLDPATARSQILSTLNNGALLVDYNGHGAEQQWSFSDFFDNSDATALTNGGRLPVYLLIDCLNGLFQDVYEQSLAEALILAPNGGAVAVWASSGFTDQTPQVSMNLAFLHEFALRPLEPIGQMVLNAKAKTTDNDVRRTWILFGDPSMKFHFNLPATTTSFEKGSEFHDGPQGGNSSCGPSKICARKE